MKKLTITIEPKGSAFADSPSDEMQRILTDLAKEIGSGRKIDDKNLMDINGNACGTVKTK